MGRTERVLAVVAVVLVMAAFAVRYARRPRVSRVQRGWNVASTKGCFTCHGPGGIRGMADPGHGLDEVPPFSGGLITMYARSEGEIREWILDGLPARVRDDPEQMKLRAHAVIAHAGLARAPLRARDGRPRRVREGRLRLRDPAGAARPPRAARSPSRLGCFNCHGPAGPRLDAERARLQGLHPVLGRDGLPRARAGRRRDPRVDPRRPAAAAAAEPPRPLLPGPRSPSRCPPIAATSSPRRWIAWWTTSTGCAPTRTKRSSARMAAPSSTARVFWMLCPPSSKASTRAPGTAAASSSATSVSIMWSSRA